MTFYLVKCFPWTLYLYQKLFYQLPTLLLIIIFVISDGIGIFDVHIYTFISDAPCVNTDTKYFYAFFFISFNFIIILIYITYILIFSIDDAYILPIKMRMFLKKLRIHA